MRIIYRQNSQAEGLQKITLLEQLGFTGIYCKLVRPTLDKRCITARPHHHTTCEIHLVTKGIQHYLVNGKPFTVKEDWVIILPPNTPHQYLFSEAETEKYSITFSTSPTPSSLVAHLCKKVVCAPLSVAAREAVSTISREEKRPREYSYAVLECGLFQLLLALARDSGFREDTLPEETEEDSRVSLARQYVLDNIERPISCPELANYCHLSQKQLTRLFLLFTGKTPGVFIRTQKILRIEQLLTDSHLSLREISDRLHFASESHFNSFFTKYAGLTPGAYRKMHNHPTQ